MNWDDQQTRRTRRPRHLEEINSVEVGFPIAWVLIGALSALLILGLVGLGAVNFLRKQAITPTPMVIPNLSATQPIIEATPGPGKASPTIPPVVTIPPTFTPEPTGTPAVVPKKIEKGVFAKIVRTDGYGASLRVGPGTNNARLNTIPEGQVVEVKDGPKSDENNEGFIWWFVRDPDNNEGWIAQEFMEPSLPQRKKQ